MCRNDPEELFAETDDLNVVCGCLLKNYIYFFLLLIWLLNFANNVVLLLLKDDINAEQPMDFTTMRGKLHMGMYTSMEEFKV